MADGMIDLTVQRYKGLRDHGGHQLSLYYAWGPGDTGRTILIRACCNAIAQLRTQPYMKYSELRRIPFASWPGQRFRHWRAECIARAADVYIICSITETQDEEHDRIREIFADRLDCSQQFLMQQAVIRAGYILKGMSDQDYTQYVEYRLLRQYEQASKKREA